jgi:hypothetical protein
MLGAYYLFLKDNFRSAVQLLNKSDICEYFFREDKTRSGFVNANSDEKPANLNLKPSQV